MLGDRTATAADQPDSLSNSFYVIETPYLFDNFSCAADKINMEKQGTSVLGVRMEFSIPSSVGFLLKLSGSSKWGAPDSRDDGGE